MNDTALTTIVESSPIELAIAGWLDAHKASTRTRRAYERTLWQFRQELHKIDADLDADVRTIMLVAQSFSGSSKRDKHVTGSTRNTRLAIICSFYDYAIQRYLLMPMDEKGHVLNPIKVVDRAKVEPYHNINWLESADVVKRLKRIDRSSPMGQRDYVLLHILFFTGRRAQEMASLRWRHVYTDASDIVTLTFEHCKGDKTMRDELPAEYSKALLAWLRSQYGALQDLEPGTPLWPSLSYNPDRQGEALGVRAIERICIRYLGVHTHTTRHSFSHAMIEAGATLPQLQDRLGHSSLQTTGIYAKVFTGAKNPHAKKLTEMFGIE